MACLKKATLSWEFGAINELYQVEINSLINPRRVTFPS